MDKVVWRNLGSRKHRKLTKQAIWSDKAARKSYSNLRAKGLKNTELLEELVGMAVAIAVGSGGKASKWSKWYSGSGKTPKTLAYFPKRLKAVADEIEKLNTHPLLRPDKESSICEPDMKPFVVWFMELPTMLRHYATHVHYLSGSMSKLFRRNKKGSVGPMGQVLDCLRLLALKETGKERPADLKRLLAAALKKVPGLDPNFYFDFEAELKNRAYRERKKLRADSNFPLQTSYK